METSIGARSPLAWVDKRLYTGGERPRALYARWRRLWRRRDLALRRRLARELDGGPRLAIPQDRGYLVLPPGRIPEANEVARATRSLADAAVRAVAPSRKKPQLLCSAWSRRAS